MKRAYLLFVLAFVLFQCDKEPENPFDQIGEDDITIELAKVEDMFRS